MILSITSSEWKRIINIKVTAMTISRDENIVLHNILFEDYNNFDKWAPFFPEFVRENSKGVLAGQLSPNSVTINDIYAVKFMNFLKAKGVYI